MKNIKFLTLLFIALLGFNSCETEDDVVFIANTSELSFSNTFQSEYILTPATAGNLAERFTWNSVETGVPTNVSYELQKSIIGDFSDAELIGTTTANEIAVTVGDMLGFANEAGLDNDPTTTDIPNTGTVSFRLKSVVGDSGEPTFSPVQTLTIVLPEATGVEEAAICEVDTLYAVGAGLPTAGWDWATPVEFACSADGVFSGNVELTSDGDANFRFFTEATNWDSGRNYPFYADDGYTIDPNLENAGDDDSNFKFVGTSGVYFLTMDTNAKTITLSNPEGADSCEVEILYGVGAGLPAAGWDWGTPVQLLCTGDGVWSGNVQFQSTVDNNNFRFFTEATNWDSGRNYPFYADDGYTIDPNLVNAGDDDSNFAFVGTDGTYLLTIDSVNKTITLE
ncbi:SusE domain-containing protein [Psychroserpens sp. Hel_I_66]|uniref:SusE domain-containing protein n=1 Tax=Psychroserpens sp. Hel_I_66 TaxID=1250004 RepID=UPI000ACD79DB|nr:SusE domain-containing protein [Psychroserpens sp. Hel_I_66]